MPQEPVHGPIRTDVVGKLLKEALETQGQSPTWLAQKTGIGQTTIYSILSGRHMASPPKLAAICAALSISVDVLLGVEPHLVPIFPETHEEGRAYARFERIWFGDSGGERISVSRGFSVANQTFELRRAILRSVYKLTGPGLDTAMDSFSERLDVIRRFERSRLEVVVESEIEDFVAGRKPWDTIQPRLVHECIEGVIARLEEDPDCFEVVVIPRQRFVINYEIINRQVVLFDAGTVSLRHTHPDILAHFLREVERFRGIDAEYSKREDVIAWLRGLLLAGRERLDSSQVGAEL